ncbi:MAG: HAD family phosphatase [Neomegalonema sp.]|nr:HAD family phosphatase [Neomegalonema sp.]
MQFEAVIFDLDGTLLDTERLAGLAFEQTCAAFDLPHERALFESLLGLNRVAGRSRLDEGLAGRVGVETFEAHWDAACEALYQKGIPTKPGAHDLLGSLQARQIPLALATSSRKHKAIPKLETSAMMTVFGAMAFGDEVENSKPAPDVFLLAAERLGVNPAACVAFEDSENGVRSAHAAGMLVVQVPDLLAPSDAIRELAHVIADSLHDGAREIGIL